MPLVQLAVTLPFTDLALKAAELLHADIIGAPRTDGDTAYYTLDMPGAPTGATTMNPTFFKDHQTGEIHVATIDWYDADGNLIP